uniref:Cytochrome c biogenesis protein CcsA n=1 Tax=Elliptochloris bilobata TaxID=381761 RepID=A0A097KQV2_9CHLO|nr:heme attachment to plastid cytochrome c [Elliptochloris bilobata]AIT95563.1 heme attachment to plastid cytochrome c [Elliptochloris bilobata]
MMAFDIENILANLSFLSLLFLLFFQWAQASFFSTPVGGLYGMGIANIALTALLLIRWLTSGHFPLSNLYESLLFLSWSFTAFHLVLQRNSNLPFLGLITTPMALFTNAFATFTLPPEMQRSTGLVPALQSNWLMMHVTIMIVSYAALLFGCLVSMAFLIVHYEESKERKKEKVLPQDSSLPTSSSFSSSLSSSSILDGTVTLLPVGFAEAKADREENSITRAPQSSLADRLDNLSYRTLGLGFPLLTIGILSGAVWANEAWGSYWSWDPKETWAFITWLVFAIYFHTRLTKNWSGTRPAIIATVGFFVLWICYLGVNLVGAGLHSYGWFQR